MDSTLCLKNSPLMRGQLWSHFTMNLMAEGVGRKNANKLRCDHELWTANCRQITYLLCFLKLSDIPELKCILQKVLIDITSICFKNFWQKIQTSFPTDAFGSDYGQEESNTHPNQKKTHPQVPNELSTTYHLPSLTAEKTTSLQAALATASNGTASSTTTKRFCRSRCRASLSRKPSAAVVRSA